MSDGIITDDEINDYMNEIPKQATDPETLRDRIMNSCIAKTEPEWWAKGEIEKLQAENKKLRELVVAVAESDTACNRCPVDDSLRKKAKEILRGE